MTKPPKYDILNNRKLVDEPDNASEEVKEIGMGLD